MKQLAELSKSDIERLELLKRFYNTVVDIFRDGSPRLLEEKYKDYFKAVPMHDSVISCLCRVKNSFKKEGIEFLDVGCGYGNIVSIADALGFYANGIEVRKDYESFHRKLHFNGKIHYCDALEFKDYGKYDVVYLFEPIISRLLMTKLTDKVAKEVKSGTIIVYCGGGFTADQIKNFKLVQLEHSIWLKE